MDSTNFTRYGVVPLYVRNGTAATSYAAHVWAQTHAIARRPPSLSPSNENTTHKREKQTAQESIVNPEHLLKRQGFAVPAPTARRPPPDGKQPVISIDFFCSSRPNGRKPG